MSKLREISSEEADRTLFLPDYMAPWYIRLALPFAIPRTVDVFEEWTLITYKELFGTRYITKIRRYH